MAYTITLDEYLKVSRCPHCSIDQPNLKAAATFNSQDDKGSNQRSWRTYICARCGGAVTAYAYPHNKLVMKVYPENEELDDAIPLRPREYLKQAIQSMSSPSGAVMLCASSVDAMLKIKGYKDGSLYKRIEQTNADGILTADMAKWAHQVRLDANDERHADEEAILPTIENANQSIEFTKTLAELLFVLPSQVNKGIAATAATTGPPVTPE